MAQITKHPVDDEADVPDSASSVDAVSDIESQRQLNDLRREHLDSRSDSVNELIASTRYEWLKVIRKLIIEYAK